MFINGQFRADVASKQLSKAVKIRKTVRRRSETYRVFGRRGVTSACMITTYTFSLMPKHPRVKWFSQHKQLVHNANCTINRAMSGESCKKAVLLPILQTRRSGRLRIMRCELRHETTPNNSQSSATANFVRFFQLADGCRYREPVSSANIWDYLPFRSRQTLPHYPSRRPTA